MRTENGILARIKNREAGELEKIQKKGNSLPAQKKPCEEHESSNNKIKSGQKRPRSACNLTNAIEIKDFFVRSANKLAE